MCEFSVSGNTGWETAVYRLIQFPSGNWIDPRDVSRVVVLPDIELACGGFAPPRVSVLFRDGGRDLIECASQDQAERLRDEIAAAVNASRRG